MKQRIEHFRYHWRGRARQPGFTLIELLVTVAVAVVLMTVAAPAFWVIIKDNRLTAQTNDFVTDAYLARGEALARGRRVTMCRCVSDATGKCVESPADDYDCDTDTSTNWNRGWVVFVDSDEDAEHDGPTEPVLRLHERLPSELDLTGTGNIGDYLSFDRRGIASTPTGDLQAGVLTLENADTPSVGSKLFERVIIVSSAGAIESCNPNPAACP